MVKHVSGLVLLLCGLWLLLSGQMQPLLLGLGLASVLLVVFLALRMDIIDQESYPIHLTLRLGRFLLFLLREIVQANLDVIRRILLPGPPISPQLLRLPLPQHTDLGRVIYANAITLTPGTVSIEIDRNTLLVHALSEQAAADLLGERLARAVPEAERSR